MKIHTYIAKKKKTIFFTLLVDMYVTVRKQVKRPFFFHNMLSKLYSCWLEYNY